jgi:hypothetical protein
MLWVGIYAVVAAGLLGATLATFDRCLGRAKERDDRPKTQPLDQPGPQAELIAG